MCASQAITATMARRCPHPVPQGPTCPPPGLATYLTVCSVVQVRGTFYFERPFRVSWKLNGVCRASCSSDHSSLSLWLYSTILCSRADSLRSCCMQLWRSDWPFLLHVLNIHQSDILTMLFGCYVAGALWNCMFSCVHQQGVPQCACSALRTLFSRHCHWSVGAELSGYYCESTGMTNVTAPCDAGFFCTLGANISTPSDGSTGQWQLLSV